MFPFPSFIPNYNCHHFILQVGWVKADTKAIQAIHEHVITHNSRVSVTHTDSVTWNLHIKNVNEDDRGGYMCQLNTDPMKSQVSGLFLASISNFQFKFSENFLLKQIHMCCVVPCVCFVLSVMYVCFVWSGWVKIYVFDNGNGNEYMNYKCKSNKILLHIQIQFFIHFSQSVVRSFIYSFSFIHSCKIMLKTHKENENRKKKIQQNSTNAIYENWIINFQN